MLILLQILVPRHLFTLVASVDLLRRPRTPRRTSQGKKIASSLPSRRKRDRTKQLSFGYSSVLKSPETKKINTKGPLLSPGFETASS